MKGRFLPTLARVKTGTLLIFLLFTCSLLAQQDSIKIEGYTIPTCGCDGVIDITVTGGAGPNQPPTSYSYFWSNGNTTQDLLGICPGTYCVTVTNGNVNASTSVKCFTVQDIPFAGLNIQSGNLAPCNFDSTGITNDCEKVCPGTTITYSASLPGSGGSNPPIIGWFVTGASTWVVNSSNNGNSIFSSVTVTWGGPGSGTVTVFSDGAGGCSGEDVLCVTVVDEPNAAFESSPAAAIAGGPLQVCLGQSVHFQNLSTGDSDFYQWLFSDDLSSSSEENPQHTYQIPGTFTVRLIASSSCLCADTTTMTVEVINAQAPTLECVATVCPGETVTYTASNGCAPYSWTVSGDGTVLNGGTATADTVSVQWNGGPIGTITLGAQPCSGAACPVAGVIEIPIVTSNAQIRGEEQVCPGSREVYTIEPFGGTGFVWTLPTGGVIVDGQGTNRVTVEWSTFPNPAPAADHSLYVQYENCYLGCGGADLIHVRILSAFRIDGPVEVCDKSSGNFSAKLNFNNAAILCNWTLTAPDGSIAWTSPAPSGASNIPFLNGPGVYRLLAIPADPTTSCSDQADWAVSVRALPADPIGISGETNICPGTFYTYEATGLPAGSNVRWSVKNGAGAPLTLNGNPVNVNWGNTGPYWLTAAQISADGLGCLSDTVGLVVTPIAAPVLSGTPQVCEDSKGAYAMMNLQNVPIQWTINPADAGSVANGQGSNNVEIFWNQPGNHLVNVTVCNQSAQFPVTVWANPDPVILHPAGLCPGNTANVQTTLSYAGYTWKDETGTILSNAPTLVLGAGVYSLEVVDANGCAGTSEFKIESWENPEVSLTTADATGFCNNANTVTLSALTNSASNYTYQWFQNGSLLPGANGSTYFTNQYGSYSVQATNALGCTASAGSITLFEFCGTGGGGNSVCNGGPLCPPGVIQCVPDPTPRCDSFTMTLNDYVGMYVPGSAQWTTGISGGAIVGTATGENPSFVYPNAGKYVVVVWVQLSDSTYCNALDSVEVELVARFDELVGCPAANSDFENQTELLPDASIGSFAWDFGDPASGPNNVSALENPSHSFAASGQYGVTFTVTAGSGCSSSVTKFINIPDSSPPAFPDPASKCAGNALEFSTAPNADILELNWDFGDPASGTANDASGSPVYHNYPAGTYVVTATSKNVYGCTASFSRNVTLQASTLGGNIIPGNPAPLCEGNTILLTAPAGAVSYLWSDDNTTTTQTLTVGQEGTYRVTLTDANGCTYSPPAAKVEVNPAPDALIKSLIFNELNQIIGITYPTVSICEGEDLALQGFSNGSASYSWSGGNGSNQQVYFTDDRNTLLPAGTHVFTVTVTSSSTGCTAVSDPFLVTVNPSPTGFFISSPTICAGSPNVLTYNGPTPANWQLIWNTGASGATLTTENPGTYYIRVLNEFGCEATSNVHTILPGPPVGSIPAGCHTRCSPDTLCMPDLPNIASWQWYLDGNPIPGATSANFIAQQSGTYWAQLTDVFGCSAESEPLSLSLYTGYGNILGQVWSDVNGNGMIDAADTLLSGITVVAYQNGSLFGAATSDMDGDFALTNVLSTNYSFNVDPFSLPPNWNIVLGQDQVSLSGCDVTGTVDFLLAFSCAAFGALELAACPGGFATYNGTNISVGGSQIFQLTSSQGCDSTLVVSVVALPTSSSSLTLQACPGNTANYNGTNLAVGSTQNFTFSNWQGCDSVVTVTVNALPSSSSSLTLSACPGNTANYNGTNLAVGSTQNFTFANWQGCDSVVTVTVTALPNSASSLTLSACPGNTVSYNGTNLAIGSTQNFTFSNWQGCDSVVTVTVSALSSSSNSLTLSTCPGGTVEYNGTTLAAGAMQDFSFTNWQGCDSVVTVIVLGNLASTSSAISTGVCPGETFVYQGITLTAGSVQNFTLTNAVGCDSVVTVTVFQKNTSTNVIDVKVCPGETYLFQGVEIAAGDSREFHFVNSELCDSTVIVFVSAHPATVFGMHTEASCSSTPTGILEATGVSGGPAPYRFSLDDLNYQTEPRFEDLDAGAYTLYVEDGNGCVFEQNTEITPIPKLEVRLLNGILPCDSAGIQLFAEILSGDPTGLTYQWWNGQNTPVSTAFEAGKVWVEVTDACETIRSEASVQWAELAEDQDLVYIPNVFMPSARDALNASFKPLFAAGITLLGFHFEVFDRWGNKLFETSSTADAWGGIFRDKDFNPGVQVWHLVADVSICGRVLHVERKGDVTVLR